MKRWRQVLDVLSANDCEEIIIENFLCGGKQLPDKGISVRWVSEHGDDGSGYPEYGMRFIYRPTGRGNPHS